MRVNTDFLIIGAGVVGLTIAREIKLRNPESKIIVLEKESEIGLHSSCRNSSVLHSGIYYPANTLKAKICSQGATEMANFHEEHNIPIMKCGKILIATNEYDAQQFSLLVNRAKENNIKIEMLNEQDLKSLEPEIKSFNGKGILVPSTSVGDSKTMMQVLQSEVIRLGIEIHLNAEIVYISAKIQEVALRDSTRYCYGHTVNAAGLFADEIAHEFGVGREYTLLPFKGIYWKIDPQAGFRINHLIYPIPDLRVPFLGVHTTTSVDGTTYLGPTAVPAFGRENYQGLEGIQINDFFRISSHLIKQFIGNKDGFRRLAWQEGSRYFKPRFAEAAKKILPRLKTSHLLQSDKVGIRAQTVNLETGRMVMDFLVENGSNSTHIINAISPAWTSAFPFARHIYENYIEQEST
jgi:(S)-2-hydroxyglutarate dehydrogenase